MKGIAASPLSSPSHTGPAGAHQIGEKSIPVIVRRGNTKIVSTGSSSDSLAWEGEFPWMVAILDSSGQLACGGSLVDEWVVLVMNVKYKKYCVNISFCISRRQLIVWLVTLPPL